MKRFALLVALLTACTASAHASPPASAARVDPAAPCFRWPAVDVDGDGVYDRVDHCTNTLQGCTVDAYGCPLDADGDGVCDGLDTCPDTPRGARVNKAGCASDQLAAAHEPPRQPSTPVTPPPAPERAPVTPSPRHAPTPEEKVLEETGVLRLENVYFETNSANLLPESETSLNAAGDALERHPELKIEIGGHTDTRGAAAANQKLSEARARSVRAYLLAHFHVVEDNLSARGYGETHPETKERNDEELLRNRRVVLRVTNPEVLPRNVKIEKQ